MPRRAFQGAGLAIGLVVAALALTGVPAQSDVLPAPLGTKMIGFYLTDDTLVHERPVNTTSNSRSTTSQSEIAVPGPGASTVEWGIYRPTHNLAFLTDGVFTLYIAGRDIAHFEQVTITLLRGEDEFSGTSRLTANSSRMVLIENTIKVPIGIDLAGATFYADDEIHIQIEFTGVAIGSLGLDAVVLYGSREHPSGLIAGVADAGGVPVSAEAQPVFLEGDGENFTLSLAPPANDTDRLRVVEGGSAADFAATTEWEWGSINSTSLEDTKLFTDTPVSVWIRPHESLIGASRDLKVSLYVSDGHEPVEERVNVHPVVWRLGAGVQKYVIGLPTEGMRIPAGATVTLAFTLWATEDDDLGRFAFIYGSTDRPASFTLGVPPGSFGIASEPDDVLQGLARGGAGAGTGPGGAGAGSGQGGGTGTGTSGGTGSNDTDPNATGTFGPGGDDGAAQDADEDGRVKDVEEPRNAVPSAGFWLTAFAVGAALAVAMRRRRG